VKQKLEALENGIGQQKETILKYITDLKENILTEKVKIDSLEKDIKELNLEILNKYKSLQENKLFEPVYIYSELFSDSSIVQSFLKIYNVFNNSKITGILSNGTTIVQLRGLPYSETYKINTLPIPNIKNLFSTLTEYIKDSNHSFHQVCKNILGKSIMELALLKKKPDIISSQYLEKLQTLVKFSEIKSIANEQVQKACSESLVVLDYLNEQEKHNRTYVSTILAWSTAKCLNIRIWELQHTDKQVMVTGECISKPNQHIYEILYLDGNQFELLFNVSN